MSLPASTSAPPIGWCWGSNGSGCLGLGDCVDYSFPKSIPRELWPIKRRFIQISCGGLHTLARDDFGSVWSFGQNEFNQLGLTQIDNAPSNSSVTSECAPMPSSTVQTSPRRITQLPESFLCSDLSAGWSHSICVGRVKEDGAEAIRVYAWGDNRYSQCGVPSTTSMLPFPTPISAFDSQCIVEVKCSWKHNLARSVDGRVFAWGENTHGQLGLGDLKPRTTPTIIRHRSADSVILSPMSKPPPPILAAQLAVGWKHSLLLLRDHSCVYAMGSNSHGQLGIAPAPPKDHVNDEASSADAPDDGSSSSAHTRAKVAVPTVVPLPSVPDDSSPPTILSIDAGWSHSVLLLSDHRLFGFGRSDFGQLGAANMCKDGERTKTVRTPTEIVLPASQCEQCANVKEQRPILQGACGSEHTIVLTDTDIWLSGWNEHGNLGRGHRDQPREMNFEPLPMFHRCTTKSTTTSITPSSCEDHSSVLATGGAAVILIANDSGDSTTAEVPPASSTCEESKSEQGTQA